MNGGQIFILETFTSSLSATELLENCSGHFHHEPTAYQMLKLRITG
jgi:hypothetical protein